MDDGGLWAVLLALFFLIVVPIFAGDLWRKLKVAKQSIGQLKAKVVEISESGARMQGRLEVLQGEVAALDKYRPILDVDADVERAQADLKVVMSKAVEREKEAEKRAIHVVSGADTQAQGILAEARKKAEEVAGEALLIKDNADEYARTAKAMKNLIDGYGDEYLVPSHSAIDDLADEYDHKQAGQDLKQARAHTKSMIKQGAAAECDYSQEYRRKTAIEFVLDAFNGKVDSILSGVKHDNYGKLEQAIKDAKQTVNHNGGAFRNARITDLYMSARLRELKWAVAANELKLQEREEQRAIREQMREEEKVRKEVEKAIKEAEKEEKLLQKALDKARKELAAANDDERAKFEAQLAELTGKLGEAEAKNQRALSMAQQTRRGHVYVISNEGSFGEQVFKIGMTRRLEPMDRVKELGDASVPFPFDVHAIISSEDAPTLENELHKRFAHVRLNKVNLRKEFFSVSLAEIKQVVDERGIEAHWTMRAEAEQFRESKAVAKQAASEVMEAAQIA